ncbi:M1 family metallopeptidase [Nocardioides dongkuii]|uniref:M1 family metallopeptidase n=1 Tax=Nocardioides dongkuii TaxID=2760089 RepID=UPI0015F93D1D|nr:M1 family metallopeptidase [Nocardioides dongkuii]
MLTPARRGLVLLVSVALGGTLLGSPSATARPAPADPRPGASGVGDPYFPLDGNGGIDVRRYEVHVSYDFESAELRGRTRVTLTAERDLSRFNLDLVLPVRSVRVDGRPAAYRKPDPHELQVTPRRPLRAGRTVDVVVEYGGRPGSVSYAGSRPWLADRHEVVTMAEPHMAPWWFPANDHPTDRARMDVHVTVPREKQVVSNGRRVGRTVRGERATTHWRSSDPMVPYLAFFAAGDFRVKQGRHRGLPWYVAVSERLTAPQQQRSMRLMRRTPGITAWAERRLGRYPFESTGGITTSLNPGFALENQTRPTYPVLGRGGRSIVVHEVAHQWFGDSVSVERWRDVWLNEGAATWMEALWRETHGGQSGQQWLETTHAGLSRDPDFWRLRIDHPGRRDLFSFEVYLRGGMTFQALRHRIGDRDFMALLRTWLRTRAGTTGSTAQFTALAEEVSGEDLDEFFDAWLRTPERPARTAANGF